MFGAVAIDVIGICIILPLLPFYAQRFGATPGALVAVFSLCQVIRISVGPPPAPPRARSPWDRGRLRMRSSDSRDPIFERWKAALRPCILASTGVAGSLAPMGS